MTPDELAKAGTEHAEQKALFAWCNCAAQYGFEWADDNRAYHRLSRATIQQSIPYEIPALNRLFAIHNQGHGDKIRGARAKAEGVKSGVPDLMLPLASIGYNGLFIELKKRKDDVVSTSQQDWMSYLGQAGYATVICKGWREAADCLKWYIE